MGSITGGRERAIFCQTLAPLIRGLEGRNVIIELKNEVILHGKLEAVDW
jgi:small nuclear ribonucleoprotein (snRNP)-like protein